MKCMHIFFVNITCSIWIRFPGLLKQRIVNVRVITDGDRPIHSMFPAKVESNCSSSLEFDLKFSPSFEVLSTINVNIIRRILIVGWFLT